MLVVGRNSELILKKYYLYIIISFNVFLKLFFKLNAQQCYQKQNNNFKIEIWNIQIVHQFQNNFRFKFKIRIRRIGKDSMLNIYSF